MSNLSASAVIDGNAIFTNFHGSLVENYVVQQMRSRHREDLSYWASRGKAEVDFIFAANDIVYPLEAKAGVNTKSQSLKVYQEKYTPHALSRATLLNLKKDGHIINYPLYAISLFPL